MVLSVTQLNSLLRGVIESEPILSLLSVRGEVSEPKRSGDNCYFTLTDGESRISCYAFAIKGFENLKEGEIVVASGTPSYYIKGGRLSFYVKDIKKENLRGDLLLKLEELKLKLESEGVFSNSRMINRFAAKLGVVTAPQGAAVRDIISVAKRRNPGISIVVFPARVQGEGAVRDVISGIKFFSESDVDTVIVARGGGSKDDLSAFNDEGIARAVYACKKPVISAVGHETDFSLCDFASDMRVPTPSAAAELATADIKEVKRSLFMMITRARSIIHTQVDSFRDEISSLLAYMQLVEAKKLDEPINRLNGLINKAAQITSDRYEKQRSKLIRLISVTDALSPTRLLRKGMAAVTKEGHSADIHTLNVGDQVECTMQGGSFTAAVTAVEMTCDKAALSENADEIW